METVASSKGQIVIPASIRRKYGIRKGTRVEIHEEKGRIVLQPVTPEYVRSLRGSLKGSGVLRTLIAERDWERELDDKKTAGLR